MNGTQDGNPIENPVRPLMDPNALRSYIFKAAALALGANEMDMELAISSSGNTNGILRDFSTDRSLLVLYLMKEDLVELEAEASDPSRNGQFRSTYRLNQDFTTTEHTVASLAIIKQTAILQFDAPLFAQLQIIPLPIFSVSTGDITRHPTSAYEMLHSVIHHAISPYFNAYAKPKNSSLANKLVAADPKDAIPTTKKRFAELELSLLHLQQDLDIPEVCLKINPVIQNAILEAHRKGARLSSDLIDDHLLTDSTFLNSLQVLVTSWVNSVQSVTKLSRECSRGSAAQEVKFWLSMESALDDIDKQLRSEGVTLTLETLRHAKRFHATVSFMADTGLKEAMDTVHKYNQLMRDFPIDDFLAATSMERLVVALDQIFAHINRRLRVTAYPIKRALPFVEAISGDLDRKVQSLLSGRQMMLLEFSEFDRLHKISENVFHTWDDHIKDFTNIARETTRRRSEKFIPIKIISQHDKTRERISYIHEFRYTHEQFAQTIRRVLAHKTVESGGKGVLTIGYGKLDVLLTADGTQVWTAAEASYIEKTSRIENSIIANLRERLSTSRNASDMFRVFSQYNSLFIRPKIRGAIREYQSILMQNLKLDISTLQERFKFQYGNSRSYAMSQLHDIPPISGTVIWANQMNRQLDEYLLKIKAVFGENWHMYAEGEKLQAETQIFKRKLDTRPIFDLWVREIMSRNVSIAGPLFSIAKSRSSADIRELRVNFDAQLISLFKEVRNMSCFNYQIPHSIAMVSKEARNIYPFAICLMEVVSSLTQMNNLIEEHQYADILLSGYLKNVQALLSRGVHYRWEALLNNSELSARAVGRSYLQNEKFNHGVSQREGKQVQFVREFVAAVTTIQNKTSTVVEILSEIEEALERFHNCPYSSPAIGEILHALQNSIDRLNMENFSNLQNFVDKLNGFVEMALAKMARSAVLKWVCYIEKTESIHHSPNGSVESLLFLPPGATLIHEIVLQKNVICLQPPVFNTKKNLYHSLHECVFVCSNSAQLVAERFNVRIANGRSDTFNAVKFDIHSKVAPELSSAYEAIESTVEKVNEYMRAWYPFQSLWEIDVSRFATQIESLYDWLAILQSMRKHRSTFETSFSTRHIGPIDVHYGQVQDRIQSKYDSWQRELTVVLAKYLATDLEKAQSQLLGLRRDIEGITLSANSTLGAVLFITTVVTCEERISELSKNLALYHESNTTLSRLRFTFPRDWLFPDQIEGDCLALQEAIRRQQVRINEQGDAFKSSVLAEESRWTNLLASTLAEWDVQKPVEGSLEPQLALHVLSGFDSQLSQLSEQRQLLITSKVALNLATGGDSKLLEGGKNIDNTLEEVQDFKSLWSHLSTVWHTRCDFMKTPWDNLNSKVIRDTTAKLAESLKEMPSRLRHYLAAEQFQKSLGQLTKALPILTSLKSDFILQRHWKQVLTALNHEKKDQYPSYRLTLADVWDLGLIANESTIRDIITQAQAEMALEEFLKQIRQNWNFYTLDLVSFKNTCNLIRGWDELFEKCHEGLDSLGTMKHSPYYKAFATDAQSCENLLSRILILFDIWIDMQRQWVYLQGVFMSNADIKQLLPMEYTQFGNTTVEFVNLMKKVTKSPLIIDVLSIPNVQQSIERLSDLLKRIQKALGEYLDRERQLFPRFYFIGDNDLLDLIGNSREPRLVAKHFRKMFSAISDLVVSFTNPSQICGIASNDGEQLLFENPIDVSATKVNEWLRNLEAQVRISLAQSLELAYGQFKELFKSHDTSSQESMLLWIKQFPGQISILSAQIMWSTLVPKLLDEGSDMNYVSNRLQSVLKTLAGFICRDLTSMERRKCQNLIAEFVHQRDSLVTLTMSHTSSSDDFDWLFHMRFDYDEKRSLLERLQIRMADTTFTYGYEYIGNVERLVQTPLTDRCYLTMTQALAQGLGGSPFGPAGTGKTETVKALGAQLGRLVMVFNCDERFDFQAMGRIFIGICQVGAWVCFDEFNRLEERILSAVSQQIQGIQLGLQGLRSQPAATVALLDQQVLLSPNTGNEIKGTKLNSGVFITMNPGYAGRSNLPGNLTKLFRSFPMTRPDKELISEVLLYSQGFEEARDLSPTLVNLFERCDKELSKQQHYDFGLRALKSVLFSAGKIRLNQDKGIMADLSEKQIILASIQQSIAPRLMLSDLKSLNKFVSSLEPLLTQAFYLKSCCANAALRNHYILDEDWFTKVLQLDEVMHGHHGVMLVGQSGCGKTSAWQTLLWALKEYDGLDSQSYILDSKTMSKNELYGHFDITTREWTDGLFTSILRKIVDNVRGEQTKRHWIVFDGDVDPDWVENLNSVLDDNKILTLPNGERLMLPSSVHILFEVEHLRHATLATVSRCGMVWFNNNTVSSEMMLQEFISSMADFKGASGEDDREAEVSWPPFSETCATIMSFVKEILLEKNIFSQALENARNIEHIISYTDSRACGTLFTFVTYIVRQCLDYTTSEHDIHWTKEQLSLYVSRKLLLSIVWSFCGDSRADSREKFAAFMTQLMLIELPPGEKNVLDFDVSLPYGDWISWKQRVPSVQIDAVSVVRNDVVIPTVDTARQEDIVYTCLRENRPLIMCGPPGSGKTMSLLNVLRRMPQTEVVGLNFSSLTTPQLFLRSLEQHCQYFNTAKGISLAPFKHGIRLVFFCDELNLPCPDQYGTQRIISFIRQVLEQGGFWRTKDKLWIRLERIYFVGACNPATDIGRWNLSNRFTKHTCVLLVDYPSDISMRQIYGAFNSAILKTIPSLVGYKDSLTAAMIDVYQQSQRRFENEGQAHYIYSPRELTRWCRGLLDAIQPLDSVSLNELIKVWVHEAIRLFSDRHSKQNERSWTFSMICKVAKKHFPNVDENTLQGPFLFSNWISRNYLPVDRSQLRDFIKERLKTFGEEELEVSLALYDDLLDHVLRIDRVFRQPQGHLVLIGTTLTRFVAWMNGMRVFQLRIHRKYSQEDFDIDLKEVLKCAGCRGQKTCFIMDESNVMYSGFLERINTLLANAEVPGLFENDELNTLITSCRDAAQKQGLFIDSQEDVYKWFTQQIIRNLHFVFTMNPPESGLSSKAAASPALFNRCVLNWFGDWSEATLFQVADNMLQDLDLSSIGDPRNDSRNVLLQCLVSIHTISSVVAEQVERDYGMSSFNTPRAFLEFLVQFRQLVEQKRLVLVEQKQHLSVGLNKIGATIVEINDLRAYLAEKQSALDEKNMLANQKLQSMIRDQQEAEQNRFTSMQFQKSLRLQEAEIISRRQVVLSDLSKAEPAVLEAQQSVQNIKKQHLTEVRSMTNPPEAVKLAMESVCTLLGHRADNWRTVQGIIRRDDFISSILNFDNEVQMTTSIRLRMEKEYMSMSNYNFESVNRASRACGPLVQWVEAQVNFSSILEKVGPLRAEVHKLEDDAHSTKRQMDGIIATITQLEGSIENYKHQYAELINEVQEIKVAMNVVKSKIERSENLLDSLDSETQRWTANEKSFTEQNIVVSGDAVLCAASLVYCGFFDQHYRAVLEKHWQAILLYNAVRVSSSTSLIGFLSTGDDRLRWLNNGLSDDDLSVENVIMLEKSKRYPLIIDPTGSAVSFLVRNFSQKRLLVTSFLDPNFTKQIESALRFGNSIVIQDAEYFDPIINCVLNKEYHRAGGRTLVTLGNQDIDFSQSFKLFLSTRDSNMNFTPDLCSRTSLVNFTITRSSLQAQSLARVLQMERPDVYERRNDIVKSRGEFASRLLQLEKGLLIVLNETSSSVLEDDRILESLEKLKIESASITNKIRNTSAVLEEMENVAAQYTAISSTCSQIFTLLQNLSTLHYFYQFSLEFVQSIFGAALQFESNSSQLQDSWTRRQALLNRLFIITYQRTTQSLLQEHRLMFGLMLVQLKLQPSEAQVLATLLNENLLVIDGVQSDENLESIRKTLSKIPEMMPLVQSMTESTWTLFWSKGTEWLHDSIIPLKSSDGRRPLFHLLLIRLLKPEYFVSVAEKYILETLGCKPSDHAMEDVLLDISAKEVTWSTPILLASVPGTDASYKIESLVKSRNIACSSIAMGALESEALAGEKLATAARSGSWVVLKNVHLSPEWLGTLEKKIRGLNAHQDFRLFLTLDLDSKAPNSIIQVGRTVIFEPQSGIKASLQNLGVVSRPQSLPKERARLLILLAWLHCVILERLRYKSIGWSKQYDINDADFECALYVIDNWVHLVAKNRSNISPAKLPWKAIRSILVTAIYGGKIDVQEDVEGLERLVNNTLNADLYEADSKLVTAEPNLSLPDGSSMDVFKEWIVSLPEHEPPTWLGLPKNAETLLLKSQGNETLLAWTRCRRLEL